MEQLFQILKRRRLLKAGKVDRRGVSSLSTSDLIDAALELDDTIRQSASFQTGGFTHCCSLSLGGGREGCVEIDCRLKKIEEMSRFAILYSDHVFINNCMSEYVHRAQPIEDTSLLHKAFYDDLRVLMSLKPLLINRMASFLVPQYHLCPSCLATLNFGHDADSRLFEQLEHLARHFFESTSINFEYNDRFSTHNNESMRQRKYFLACEGPEDLFEHGSSHLFWKDAPLSIQKRPSLLKKAIGGATVTLSKTLRKELGLHYMFASEVMKNVVFNLMASTMTGAKFVTDKNLHIAFLNKLSGSRVAGKNEIAMKHMASILPFAADIPINKLIKLRCTESDSFIVYRAALGKAIEEYRASGEQFSDNDAKSIYNDILRPQLSQLQRTVDSAQKKLVSSVVRSAFALVGTIAFGIYTALLPQDYTKLASLLGAGKFTSDLLKELMCSGDAARSIENEELYFLWKVRNLK